VRRGDLVVVSAPCDYGKPRPAVVVQSDNLALDSILVALVTSDIVDAPLFRLWLEPTAANGLALASQVMVDKVVAMPRAKVAKTIGRIDDASLLSLNRMLSIVLGLAD
jgi:mRNA interferase MazF